MICIGGIHNEKLNSECVTQILMEYYGEDCKRLHHIVNNVMKKFGGIYQKDYDDFYSLANEEFFHALNDYNGSGAFEGFLYFRLERKIKSLITKRNRQKRADVRVITKEDGTVEKIFNRTLSLEEPVNGEGESITYGDIIKDDHNMLTECLEQNDSVLDDENLQLYMDTLTENQRKVAALIMEGYDESEIKRDLHMSNQMYNKIMSGMKAFERTIYLKRKGRYTKMETREVDIDNQTTLETNKDTKLSVASIIKKIDNFTIRFDHPLQRSSGQWTNLMKGNLISDILQGNPLPEIVLAEQVVHGLGIIWDIDGKQRCTNVHSFRNNEYRINKKVTRGDISYQAIMKDKDGKPILDEKGFPQAERRTFDIRNKKFSDLPEELQDKLMDYNFKIVQYFNCSSEDIAYHIERYNSGRPMNAGQKGITKLGEVFAEMTKNISAMSFFAELGGYKVSDAKNGVLDRVVLESIMAINFLHNWIKDHGDMCLYIKTHATEEMFEELEEMVDELSKIENEEFLSLFDSKNSYVYFATYKKFKKLGLPNERFADFLLDFHHHLREKKVNDKSYYDLEKDNRSSKDKRVSIGKIEILETLMNEYFANEMDQKTTDTLDIEEENMMLSCELDVMDFVKDNVDHGATEEDIELYELALDDYIVEVDSSSELLDKQNKPSLIALIAYAFKIDRDNIIPKWITRYFDQHHSFISNQKENYLHMKKDFDEYIRVEAA